MCFGHLILLLRFLVLFLFKFSLNLGPIITSVSSLGTEGGIVRLYGSNFGNTEALVKVLIGGVACNNVTVNISNLICVSAPGTGSQSVVLLVDGQNFTKILIRQGTQFLHYL